MGDHSEPVSVVRTDSHDEYVRALKHTRKSYFVISLILLVLSPLFGYYFFQACGRPFHWHNVIGPELMFLGLLFSNFYATNKELKTLTRYDEWVREGRPRTFNLMRKPDGSIV